MTKPHHTSSVAVGFLRPAGVIVALTTLFRSLSDPRVNKRAKCFASPGVRSNVRSSCNSLQELFALLDWCKHPRSAPYLEPKICERHHKTFTWLIVAFAAVRVASTITCAANRPGFDVLDYVIDEEQSRVDNRSKSMRWYQIPSRARDIVDTDVDGRLKENK